MTAPRPARLDTGSAFSVDAQIDGLPPLPPIDWQAGDFTAPLLLDTPAALPQADVVVIAWAEAEWAALQHVFCASVGADALQRQRHQKLAGLARRFDGTAPGKRQLGLLPPGAGRRDPRAALQVEHPPTATTEGPR